MPSSRTTDRDPLALALLHKTRTGAAGAAEGRPVAAGEGWRVVDIVCTTGPGDRPFEERHASASFSLVLSGTFVYRSERGASLMSPGALILGNAGHAFECSHEHGEGDRCLSVQLDPALLERLANEAGAARAELDRDRIPPLRVLAPLMARATRALAREDSFEEIALELAATALRVASHARRDPPAPRDTTRIARVLRLLEAHVDEAHTLADLARTAGLGRYHFLRTFKAVTGVTPHQWLIRARLREAAARLASGRAPVTEVALDVGFEDLSNFIRSFRAEFGVPPGRYRATA